MKVNTLAPAFGRRWFAYTHYLFISLFLSLASIGSAQEICNNGIDDDGDGLIDCYDSDCAQNAACAGFFYGKPPISCSGWNSVTSFGLNTMWSSTINATTRSTMFVADIDADGIPEVICHKDNANQLYVLNGANGTTKLTINCPAVSDLADAIAVGDVDGDGFAEIYVVTNNSKLNCFTYLGAAKVGFTPPTVGDPEHAPAIYDFDGDGVPEILAGNRIFNSLTGALIVQGTGSKGSTTGVNAAHPVAADVLPDSYCPNCNGLELICGNEVYSVDIGTATLTLENTAPAGLNDGLTAVADMNMDGAPDVVVTAFQKVYIWDPRTGAQIGVSVTVPGRGGRPSVADYDGDGLPEIGVGAQNFYIVIDDVASGMPIRWQAPISDASACTTGSAFDFECDGSFEVVYRDEDSLFIFDGSTGVKKASTYCASGTRTEYPTIVDVDGDGQANIVCACGTTHQGLGGAVKAFNSNINQWVSTRKVMNQHSYFVVNINDDLSIPRVMQSHTSIPRLNGFITQAATYDINWNSTCIPMPDFSMHIDTSYFTVCSQPANFQLTYTICNNGSRDNPSAVYISFYNGNPHTGGTFIVKDSTTAVIAQDSCLQLTTTIPFSSSFSLYAYVNDAGTSSANAPSTLFKECDSLNNGDTHLVTWNEIIPTLSGLAPNYCPIGTAITMTGTPAGGIFSGNGVSGSSFTPLVAGVGTHTIHYTYTNSFNSCVYDTTADVTVNPKPSADFSVNAVCENAASIFTDNSSISSGSISNYNWSFGDGNSSNQQSPSHNYSIAGNYNATLIVQSNNSCLDTVSKPAVVNPNPATSFSAANVCFNEDVQFNNSTSISSGSITQWTWDFDDGQTSNQQSPTHNYASAGSYNVSLIAQSNNNCYDTVTNAVTVYPKPVAAFNTADVCLDQPIVVTNGSTISTGSITQTTWDFGDGQNGSATNPTHLYSNPGTYNITLVIVSDNNCTDSVSYSVVAHPMPVASFNVADVCTNQTSIFNNSSSILSGTINQYSWDFADGQNSNQQSPSHLYAASGTYAVTLILVSDNNCADTITNNANVYPNPVAAFSKADICFGQDAVFNNSSSISSGTINQYNWDFGDGQSGNQASPHNTYASYGVYTINLIVISDQNCSDTTAQQINVFAKPLADFTTTSVCEGNTSVFTDNSSIASGTIVSYSWDFADGNTDNQQSPNHLYASAGNYNVSFAVSSDNNCVDTVTKVVTVNPVPNADFQPGAVCLNQSNSFNNVSNISSGSITQWFWDFGDAQNSNLQNPTHVYAQQGAYTVLLVATSDNNCVDSISKQVNVYDKPVAAFTVNEVCQGQTTIINDQSSIASGTLVQWNYDLGNGQSASQSSPSFVYPDDGSFTIILIVTSDQGCMDTASQIATVNPLPLPNFSANNICLGETTLFNNQSTIWSGSITNYFWNFGDGNNATLNSPSHLFASTGNFQVKLLIISDKGCDDSLVKTVSVYDNPVAIAVATPACYNESNGTISATCSNGTAPYSYLWSGAQTTSSVQNLVAAGYNLTVTDANNCSTTTSVIVSQPASALSVSVDPIDAKIDLGGSISIVLSNNYNDANAVYTVSPSYALSCLSCATFEANPYQTTTYNVQVTDTNGCVGYTTFTVNVDEAVPVFVPNAFTPNGDGSNDSWQVFASAVKQFEVAVYNRWGEKVYQSSNINESWDGSWNAKASPSGVYVYSGSIVFLNNKTRHLKGSVTLIK